MSPTIKKIAEIAGVSRGTVDRVIYGRGNVNPVTEARIRLVMQQLDYQPNRVANTLLKNQKEIKIGIVIFNSEHPFFQSMLYEMKNTGHALSNMGCTVNFRPLTSVSARDEIDAINELLSAGCDGFVIAPIGSHELSRKIQEIKNKGFPTVTVNTDLPDSGRIAYVGCNYETAGKTAASMMILLTGGKGNIGLLRRVDEGRDIQETTNNVREKAFLRKIAEEAPNLHVIEYTTGKSGIIDDIEAYETTMDFLAQHPEISAMFLPVNGSYGVCRAIENSGRKDIKTIAFDDISFIREMMKKGIVDAAIYQDAFTQGSFSIRLMYSFLLNRKLPSQEYYYTDVSIHLKDNAFSEYTWSAYPEL